MLIGTLAAIGALAVALVTLLVNVIQSCDEDPTPAACSATFGESLMRIGIDVSRKCTSVPVAGISVFSGH